MSGSAEQLATDFLDWANRHDVEPTVPENEFYRPGIRTPLQVLRREPKREILQRRELGRYLICKVCVGTANNDPVILLYLDTSGRYMIYHNVASRMQFRGYTRKGFSKQEISLGMTQFKSASGKPYR